MNSPRINREGWLYGLAFLLALTLRVINLGGWPLTDLEAAPALQALHLAQGLKPDLGPQPAYILLTAPLFFGFGGGTNFLARLVPALAGSFLVFLPFLFRHRIASRPAIVLAFFLALDPGLLALSRQAGSSILAITFALYAWACWEHEQPRLAGLFGGLALLGGTSIWMGLLAVGLAWAISQGLDSRREKDQGAQITDRRSPVTDHWKPALISLLLTLLFIGTLFFLAPNGLSAALASLPAFLTGWVKSSDVPAARLAASLFFYQPLVTLLALGALVRGWRQDDRVALRLSLWMLVAILLAVFYPAHQVTDLGWALVPLCALAALELARHIDIQPEEWVEVGGVTLLTALILIFAWLDLATLLWQFVPSPEASVRVGLFFGSLILLAVSLVLVAFGWSVRAAQRGGMWGAVIALGLYSLGATFSAGGLRATRTPELWSPGAYPAQADLVVSTLADLSEWDRGFVNSLSVTITDVRSAALLWVLRDYQVDQASTLDMASAPSIVITSQQADPSLAAVYRGQDFAWLQTPQWEGIAFTSAWEWLDHWLHWLILRDLPYTSDTILLWARDDLFLDAVP
jgi:hypothetical protein